MAEFHEDGIGFHYPDNWTLQREQTDDGWTVSVQSPQTAFFLVTYDPDMPEQGHMAETALEALAGRVPRSGGRRAGRDAGRSAGRRPRPPLFQPRSDQHLLHAQLLRAGGTILVLWQANDLELDEVEPIFQAMCASLHLDEE